MTFYCPHCGRTYPVHTRLWRCKCGEALSLRGRPPFRVEAIDPGERSLWRYREMLPVREEHIVSLGEGFTPLVEARLHDLPFLAKLEFLAPTGSFKDRGTAVMVSFLKELGIKRVVDDSSGNAGASLAAYAARAGMRASIYVPAHASPIKRAQIAAYGAELIPVLGPRARATEAAQAAVSEDVYYASHAHNPLILEGTKTLAYELWEQLDGESPDALVLPVGQGTLLLGAYLGFSDLIRAGLLERMPRLFAVQATGCAPLYRAYKEGKEEAVPVERDETVAEGIRITRPVRARLVLRAVRESGGAVLAVNDEEIKHAQSLLAQQGLYVEPTSAVPVAALPQLREKLGTSGLLVIPLTGSGLKTSGQKAF